MWRSRHLVGRDEGTFPWARDAIDALIPQAETVLKRACADSDDGTRGGGDEPVSGGRYQEDGSVSGPVPQMVLANLKERHVKNPDGSVAIHGPTGEPLVDASWRDDPVRCSLDRLLGFIVLLREGIEGCRAELAYLNGLPAEEARKLVERRRERAGAECANPACRRWVENTPTDALRAGRCRPCYRWRLDHAGEERPRDLCRADTGARTDESLWPNPPDRDRYPDGFSAGGFHDGPRPSFYRDLHATKNPGGH